MTDDEKDIIELKKDNVELRLRVTFLEKIVYWFIGFVALNLIGSFLMWVTSLKK